VQIKFGCGLDSRIYGSTGTAWYVIFFGKALVLSSFIMFLVTLSQEWNYRKDFSAKYGLHENH
jgi:hypothetical protein